MHALETRKTNGQPYLPKTIHQLLCGLLRNMRDVNLGCPNFLDKKDSRFKTFHGTLDLHYHHLHGSGLGRPMKHARVLSDYDEDKLWRSGVLGTSSPQTLQNAVFYMAGKAFSLRGGTEMCSLAISQIKRFRDPDRQKMCQRQTAVQSHISTKVVPVFACPQAGERCTVYLLDLYLSKLPQEAFTQDVENMSSDPNHQWYTNVLVGKNTQERKLAIICESNKTDQYRDGSVVVIARTGTDCCPMAMLKRYMRMANISVGQPSDKYLFRRLVNTKMVND